MDPNEALKKIRELLKIRRLSREESAELQELVEGLDEWITKGGFLPSSWSVPRSSKEPMNQSRADWPHGVPTIGKRG